MMLIPAPWRRRRAALVPWAALLTLALIVLSTQAYTAIAFEPWWVQNHTETELWSGPDSRAISFGTAPQWTHFLVVAPQQGSRLQVMDARTGNYAFIDATAVGPSAAPMATPLPQPSPAAPKPPAATPSAPKPAALIPTPAGEAPLRAMPRLDSPYETWWVANYMETSLWDGPDKNAANLGTIPQFRRLLVVEPQSGERLKVWTPEKDGFAYVDASVVGPAGPSIWLRAHPIKTLRQVGLPGRAIGDKTYVRSLPAYDDETELRHAPHNSPLDVKEEVQSADGARWYRLVDGGFILASEVRLPRPVEKSLPGRWIDADLHEPAMVTAYEGDKAVYTGLAVKGISAFKTPVGTFYIQRRVENETMDSETLVPPIPRDVQGGYYLKDVLYTQYFAADGSSIHYNYWLVTFGYAGSHGCLGMNLEDSKFFWDWATIGTPVVIR